MNPAPTAPAPATPDRTAWIAPSELGRAQQLKATHAHLLAQGLELKWYPNAELLAEATAQETAVQGKSNTAVLRPALTEDKRTAIAAMSQPLTELRGLIKKKFKDQYAAYYPQFGLVQSGKNWVLPIDQDELVGALQTKLLPALLTHGFGADADAGTAVWQPLLTTLAGAQTQALGVDAARSTARTATTPQDEKTDLALRSIVHLLQAHHPTDWEGMLRGWGWRKTSF